ncbi:hypothetical protein J6590_101641 [Homalodisca vitripennis]|nr:hypothetical protein J6590_101641 [Homalodisca vitripennis]
MPGKLHVRSETLAITTLNVTCALERVGWLKHSISISMPPALKVLNQRHRFKRRWNFLAVAIDEKDIWTAYRISPFRKELTAWLIVQFMCRKTGTTSAASSEKEERVCP